MKYTSTTREIPTEKGSSTSPMHGQDRIFSIHYRFVTKDDCIKELVLDVITDIIVFLG